MSWVSGLVRTISKHTTDRVFGGSAESTAATVPTTAVTAEASTAASAPDVKSTPAAAAAAATASVGGESVTASKLTASEELEKLKAENAKLKHTFRVIKLKLDKSGKTAAVADGAGTPAATANAKTNQEIKDLIARIIAQENAKSAAGTPITATTVTATATAPAATASTASTTGTGSTTTAVNTTSADDPFAAAQKEKYGTASTASFDSASVSAAAAAATDTKASNSVVPTAIFYGEDVYSSKEDAERQSGVDLFAYGRIATNGKEVVARDPRFASAVFASDTMGADEEEVIVIDADDAKLTTDSDADSSWWSVVENPNPSASRASAAAHSAKEERDAFQEEPAVYLEPTSQGTATDGFAILEDEDVVGAISDFSAQCVRRFRGAKQLDPNQMQALLQSTFAAVEPPSKLGRVIQLGQLAYSGYGWLNSAYWLYRQPAIVRGTYAVARWVLFLVI